MDEERILLGGWLLGYNLADMSQLEESDFHYSKVFRLLKDGKNSLEISRATGIPIVELAKMQSEYNYTFYRQIFERWVKQKIYVQIAHLKGERDIEVIQKKIDYLLSARETVAPEKNLPRIFQSSLEARRNDKTVKYGLPTLDRLTGGIRRKELTSLAARPGVGKSAIALQIALRVQSDGNKVLFFPLEMSTEQLMDRVLLMYGLADAPELRSGKMPMEKEQFAKDLFNDIEKSGNLKIYEGQNDIEKIRSAIHFEKPYLVVIDQLTQLKSKRAFQSRREQFSYMTNELKAMAMQENVAIMLLCQINRDAQNTEPTMANLKESGSIEEDSDNVILLHRLRLDQMRDPEMWTGTMPTQIKLEKHRNGETGEFIAAFMPGKTEFRELANEV